MAEGGRSSRGRSRKRKSTRGKAVFAAVLKVILVLLIAAGLLFSSTYVYRYWEGSRTSTTPLETGREIVPVSYTHLDVYKRQNHDCGERIGFANRILEKRGLYLEGKLEAPVRFVDIPDQWGFVRVHLAPFAKPAEVRSLYRC